MEELNRLAFEWSTDRQYHRPVGKAGIIPAIAFAYEQSFLNKLPPYVQAPYRDHQRLTDQYGYAAFAGNYYWIPKTDRNKVTLLEYGHCLKIFSNKQLLVEYELPTEKVRNQTFFPKGYRKPNHRPNNRKQTSTREEAVLRSLSHEVDRWLTESLSAKGISRHLFLKRLYGLHLKLAPALFLQAIKRAADYQVQDIKMRKLALLTFTTSDSILVSYAAIVNNTKEMQGHHTLSLAVPRCISSAFASISQRVCVSVQSPVLAYGGI